MIRRVNGHFGRLGRSNDSGSLDSTLLAAKMSVTILAHPKADRKEI